MQQNSNGTASLVVFAILIVIVVLRRRGVTQSKNGTLEKGQRQRPVAITCLDPVISLVFIGPVLWDLLERGVGHSLMLIPGAIAGVPFGLARARTMYVRSDRATKSVILRRSPLEYGLIVVLLALRLAETPISKLHNALATYLLTAMIAFAVIESIARAADIIWRYYHETPSTEPAT